MKGLKPVSLFKWLVPVVLWTLSSAAFGQHLIWRYTPKGARYACIYGEVQVLATNKTIYYCGCNWWPGNPAGGYTGIQDAGDGRHLMIFSIWDTSPTLHPKTLDTDPRAQANRFGGEGEGAHTHLDYNWSVGETYRYFATKEPDATGANTLTRVYFYDKGLKKWVREATISSPNDGHDSVPTFGGMLNSFLENWSGEERSQPKLALYRLWVGSKPSDLTSITDATGDGNWGILNDSFYLAEGDDAALTPIFASSKQGDSPITRGNQHGPALTVHARKLPRRTVRDLENLAKH